MKNNGLLALALVVFLSIAWYRQCMVPLEEAKNVEKYKAAAQENAQKGAPEIALRLYGQALKVKDTIESRKEMFGLYQKCVEEQSVEIDSKDFASFVTKTMNLYADDETAYEMAMEYWKNEGNLVKCASVMKTALAHDAVSEQLQQDFDAVKYTYRINRSRYLDAMHASEGIVPVKNGDKWVYFNSKMSVLFEREFEQANICNDGIIAVQMGDTVKLLNAKGEVENVIKLSGTQLAGAFGNHRIVIEKDEKYSYLDTKDDRTFGWYDFAGVYVNKRAAVRQGAEWTVINTAEEPVLSGVSAVALDPYGRCALDERIIAQKDGIYGMYDLSGKKLADLDVEDVKAFGGDTYAAACKSGKWGYIDRNGQWAIEPRYEEAESFSSGFGAVKMDGLWGFIDRNGMEAVECRFDDVRNFTPDGKVLVHTDEGWNVLEFLCK